MKKIKKETVQAYIGAIQEMKSVHNGITNNEANEICKKRGVSRSLLFHLKNMGYVKNVDDGRHVIKSKSLRSLSIKLITHVRVYSNKVKKEEKPVVSTKAIKTFGKEFEKQKKFDLKTVLDDSLIQELKNRGFKISKVITQEY